MPTRINWAEAMAPLLEKYKRKKHPLDYHNVYQLLVMVVLSAQSSDDAVNKVAPQLFATFPDIESLAQASPEGLWSYFTGIRNFAHKAKWLTEIAKKIGTNDRIPLTMEELVELPGIGRKSASVILRGAGKPPEGIIVDIHVVRVAPRLGIVKEDDPKKMEEQLMKILPREEWEAGMSMSFLGREICRPEPLCEECLMNGVCAYYQKLVKTGKAGTATGKGTPGAGRKAAAKTERKAAAKAGKKAAAKAGKKVTGKAGKAVRTGSPAGNKKGENMEQRIATAAEKKVTVPGKAAKAKKVTKAKKVAKAKKAASGGRRSPAAATKKAAKG